MSITNHLQKLRDDHTSLDDRIDYCETHHPSMDDDELTEMKKRRLLLKDKISAIEHETNH